MCEILQKLYIYSLKAHSRWWAFQFVCILYSLFPAIVCIALFGKNGVHGDKLMSVLATLQSGYIICILYITGTDWLNTCGMAWL